MSLCKEGALFNTYIITSQTSEEEIIKLKETGLPIFFIDREDAYYDEIGGFHDGPVAWNPHGVYCGECSFKSCSECSFRDKLPVGVAESRYMQRT